MAKINDFIYKHIGLLSLYTAITAFISFSDELTAETESIFYDIFHYISLPIPYLSFFRHEAFNYEVYIDDSSFYRIGFELPAFLLLLFIGAIVYIISKKAEKRLLQFCYAIILLASIVSLLVGIMMSFLVDNYIHNMLMFIVYILKTILVIYISYIFLKRSSQDTPNKVVNEEEIYMGNGETYTLTAKKASKGQRFLHYLIDPIVIILIFSRYIYILSDRFQTTVNLENEESKLMLVFLIISILYYLFFEGIFKTTPGKYLTQTIVVSLGKERVSFGQILGRTFARKIPLEPFSFFGRLGWHDMFPKTTVVQKQTHKSYSAFVIAILLAYIMVILVVLFKHYNRYY